MTSVRRFGHATNGSIGTPARSLQDSAEDDAIDEINRTILSLLHDDARTTYRVMADAVGLSINAVRDRVRAMESDNIILGYQARIATSRGGDALLLFKRLKGAVPPHPTIWTRPYIEGAYMGSGAFQLIVQLRPRDHDASVRDLKHSLAPLGYRLATVDVVRPAGRPRHQVPTESEVDAQDLHLLDLLRLDGRATIRKLAAAVRLPETTVRDRLHRLEGRGILRGVHAIVDSATLGYTQEAWIIATVPEANMDDVSLPLARHGDVTRVLCSTTHPDRIAIHALGSPGRPLSDIVDPYRGRYGLKVLQYLPVEKTLRANAGDKVPGMKEEKVEAAILDSHLESAAMPGLGSHVG